MPSLSHLLAPRLPSRPRLHPPAPASLRPSPRSHRRARPLPTRHPFLVRGSASPRAGRTGWAATPSELRARPVQPRPPAPAPQPPGQPPPAPSQPERAPPRCVLGARPFSAARHGPAPGAPRTHPGADLGPAPRAGVPLPPLLRPPPAPPSLGPAPRRPTRASIAPFRRHAELSSFNSFVGLSLKKGRAQLSRETPGVSARLAEAS